MDNTKEKTKYGIWAMTAFMLKLAWQNHKMVLAICLILAGLAIAVNMLNLFMAPAILEAIQTGETIGTVITTILLFGGAAILVHSLDAYFKENKEPRYAQLRYDLIAMRTQKHVTTSYPNIENQDFRKQADIAECLRNNDAPGEAIWSKFTDLFESAASFVLYFVIIATLELWIIAIVAATTTIAFIVNRYIDGWKDRRRKQFADCNRRMLYVIQKTSDHTLAKDVRIFSMQDWLNDMFSRAFKGYMKLTGQREKVIAGSDIMDIVFSFLRNGAAYFFLIHLVIAGEITAPEFLLMFIAIGGFTKQFNQIFTSIRELNNDTRALSGMREFFEFDEPFKFDDGLPLEPDLSKTYDLELRNVSFRYPGTDKDTLTNINLTIRSGENLAVVGLNGAGKTTLVKLLCGFYDPTEGEVLLNGKNIKEYNRRDYYRHFSAVFQDFSILPTSIASNIYQSYDVDMVKVKDSIRRANLSEKIESLTNKHDTNITKRVYEDGVELSGGETQRLMMARALYKDAPIIVLDEPTAALDPIAESDLYSRYHELTEGRTSVYISHRLASTRFCDRVVYIENNIIAEEGSHNELLAKSGRYAELFELQSHYYKEGAVSIE